MVLLNLFSQLLLTLVFVELRFDFSLLLTPVLEVFNLFELFFSALSIDLILNGVLYDLLFYPFLLVDLKTFLALLELDLLLLQLLTKHLLTLFVIDFLLLGFLILPIESKFIEGGPLVDFVFEAAHVASLIFVRVDFHDAEILPKSLTQHCS